MCVQILVFVSLCNVRTLSSVSGLHVPAFNDLVKSHYVGEYLSCSQCWIVVMSLTLCDDYLPVFSCAAELEGAQKLFRRSCGASAFVRGASHRELGLHFCGRHVFGTIVFAPFSQ